jgi:uncharacterized protein (TIGR03790 family)
LIFWFFKIILVMGPIILLVGQVEALRPEDLVVVYNSSMAESKEVAEYYALRRNVPAANLLRLKLPKGESMSRETYEKELAAPVRQFLSKRNSQNSPGCILLVYGVPLRVLPPPSTEEDQKFAELAGERKKYCLDTLLALTETLKGICLPKGEIRKKEGKREVDLKDPIREVIRELHHAGERISSQPPCESLNRERAALNSVRIALLGFNPITSKVISEIDRKPTLRQQGRIDILQLIANLKFMEASLLKTGISPQSALELAAYTRTSNGIIGELEFWSRQERAALNKEALSAVDSEVSLVLHQHYSIADSIPNPLRPEYDKHPLVADIRQRVFMVSRLDGPSPDVARRLVDDAMAAEEKGLDGIFYIDARGLSSSEKVGSYGWYDKKLQQLAGFLNEKTRLKVKLDNDRALFQPGSAPSAALYCGWYSLKNYVDAFDWLQGSVGFHVASGEASTLRSKMSRAWCRAMLEKGICATLGPVAEPYLHSFPAPEQFFPLLLTGRYTLVEVYFRTIPLLSWRQILIGDPLYNPFKKKPALGLEDLPSGLAIPDEWPGG